MKNTNRKITKGKRYSWLTNKKTKIANTTREKTTTHRKRRNANRKILKGERCLWLTNTNKKMTNTTRK